MADDRERGRACAMCGGRTRPSFAICYCCSTTALQLGMPLVPVVATGTYRIGDRWHRLLRGYKDAPVREARRACLRALAAALEGWFEVEEPRLVERFGAWTTVTTVPSSHRPGRSPADAIVASVDRLAGSFTPLLVRGPGVVDHLVAARDGFVVAPDADLEGARLGRVVVFDDSVTTGSHAQSAAAALRRAGVTVAGVLAVGRALGPSELAACNWKDGRTCG